MIFALFATAVIAGATSFYNKRAINNGMSPKTHLFALNIGIALLSPLLFLFYPFQMEFSCIPIIMMVITALAISVRLINISNSFQHISPLEVNAFATLSLVITFTIDTIFKITAFQWFSVFALIIVLAGCYIIAKGGKNVLKAKKSLFLQILAQATQGYATYFALQYMSSSSFLFFVFVGTALVMLPLYKHFSPITISALKFGLAIQFFGLINAILEVILASASPTYFVLRIPAIMVATMALTYVIKKDVGEKPDKIQMLGALIVFIGLVAYALTQI